MRKEIRLLMKIKLAIILCLLCVVFVKDATAQSESPESARFGMVCDPSKVMTSQTCIKCHAKAFEVWKQTPHSKTFDELHRTAEAKQIAQRMGLSSIKRGSTCITCHYTLKEKSAGKARAVEGVSCESCHGAAKEWVGVHNVYGARDVTRETETPAHRLERVRNSISLGMRNPRNPYLLARSCYSCHTVPNEKLVNIGGHKAGSVDFDLVAWSQGTIRHKFIASQGDVNQENTPERLRLLFISGIVAEMEFGLRAVGAASEVGTYGKTVANRAATSAVKLYKIQQDIKNPLIENILVAFADAELKTNNSEQLNAIADKIKALGITLASDLPAAELSAIDKLLPKKSQYK